MPILEVLGFNGSPEQEQLLIRDLKQFVASIKELEITTKQVTPYIIPATQEIPGQVILVKIVGLFEKKERTTDVRKMLARKVFVAVWQFLQKCGMSTTEFVEVINGDRINPDFGDYYAADPRTWRPEDVLK